MALAAIVGNNNNRQLLWCSSSFNLNLLLVHWLLSIINKAKEFKDCVTMHEKREITHFTAIHWGSVDLFTLITGKTISCCIKLSGRDLNCSPFQHQADPSHQLLHSVAFFYGWVLHNLATVHLSKGRAVFSQFVAETTTLSLASSRVKYESCITGMARTFNRGAQQNLPKGHDHQLMARNTDY